MTGTCSHFLNPCLDSDEVSLAHPYTDPVVRHQEVTASFHIQDKSARESKPGKELVLGKTVLDCKGCQIPQVNLKMLLMLPLRLLLKRVSCLACHFL